jgi:hypothetical protein
MRHGPVCPARGSYFISFKLSSKRFTLPFALARFSAHWR